VEAIDYNKLADALASKINQTPIDLQIWGNQECADYLKQSLRTFRDRTSKHYKFPKPIPFPSEKGRAHGKWYAIDVINWAKAL
jgi:hypothetical protein